MAFLDEYDPLIAIAPITLRRALRKAQAFCMGLLIGGGGTGRSSNEIQRPKRGMSRVRSRHGIWKQCSSLAMQIKSENSMSTFLCKFSHIFGGLQGHLTSRRSLLIWTKE